MEIVKIPATEVAIYQIDYKRPMGDRRNTEVRKEAKDKLLKAIEKDGMKAIGRVKTTREYSERFALVTHWLQAAPKKHWDEPDNGKPLNTLPPPTENIFILMESGERRVITCQCYHQLSTTGKKELKVEVHTEMTGREALEAGWGSGEVYEGGAIVWLCPKCFARNKCKHVYEVWFSGDKISIRGNGSEAMRQLMKDNTIDAQGMVKKAFHICSKCNFHERIKE